MRKAVEFLRKTINRAHKIYVDSFGRSEGESRNYEPILERYSKYPKLMDRDTKAYDLGYDGKLLSEGFAKYCTYFRLPWYTPEQVDYYKNDPTVRFSEHDWEKYYLNPEYRSI